MLGMGVLGIYGAASPGECVWVACHLLLGPRDLSEQTAGALLPCLSVCPCAPLSGQRQSLHLPPCPLGGSWNPGGSWRPPFLFPGNRVLTAGFTVNFKTCLWVDILVVCLFCPLRFKLALQPGISLEENLFRTEEGTLESLTFSTFCRWRVIREVRCLAQGSGPAVEVPDSLLHGDTPSSPPLPASGSLLFEALSLSCDLTPVFWMSVIGFSVLFCLDFTRLHSPCHLSSALRCSW